jgi:GR25 family glycosyltransferase involved in LPS biosynthesis
MGGKNSKYKEGYVIVNPDGGLGNQLFQIANGFAYSKRNNKKLLIYSVWNNMSKSRPSYWRSYLKNLDHYTIHPRIVKKVKSYMEPKFSYNPIPVSNQSITLKGYYQSEKYFEDYKNEIKELFQLPEDLQPNLENILNFKEGICVAVHIRRGDYLKNPNFHICLQKEYYEKAKQVVEEKLGFIPNYYYFSDDIEWVKNEFKDDIRENDKFISNYKDYEEMYIMEKCDHFIVANSSFSWWAAWLSSTQNEENKIVIAPDTWFGYSGPQDYQDIYCEKWIKINIQEYTKSIKPWKDNYECYYINLEHRTDRKEQIEFELSKVFTSFTRFNAIKNSNGLIGCCLSQIEVLKKGLLSDKDYIFIFEDDFVWELKTKDIEDNLNSIFLYDFNIVLLTYHLPLIKPKKLSNKKLGFFENCQTTAGYVIHKRFIFQLIQNFQECLNFSKKINTDKSALDQNWKKLQKFENKFLVASPRLGKQRPSYSDILKKEVSYGGTCFMGILSCEKYKDRRTNQNLSTCPFEYRYFIGNPELSEPFEDFEEKIVYLPCKDDYESLTEKVYEMIKWINVNYPHIDYIFKTDDDVSFNFLNLIKNFKEISLKKTDYAGNSNKCKEGMSDYLQKKDPKNPLIKIPKCTYSSGGGYFISKKCVDILIKNLLKEKFIFEDQSVGYCLNKDNIYPVKIKLQNYSCFW